VHTLCNVITAELTSNSPLKTPGTAYYSCVGRCTSTQLSGRLHVQAEARAGQAGARGALRQLEAPGRQPRLPARQSSTCT